MFNHKDKNNLLGILESVEKIKIFTAEFNNPSDFFNDIAKFDAVLMNFIVIGEMVDRVSLEFKENNQQIDWFKIKGFRNIIAHDYFGVDAEEVWQISKNDIPKLEIDIKKLLKY